MRLFAQAFSRPKAGSSSDEYEDAFCPLRLRRPSRFEEDRSDFRVAVADGATETSFSGLWARMLVRSYVEGRLLRESFELTLQTLQDRWQRYVNRRPLPWYAEEKVRSGAAAAFLGLHLKDGEVAGEGRWESLALGDCCLVQIRGEEVIERFPLEHAADFSNSPFLLSSNRTACDGWPEQLLSASGQIRVEDSLFLMTDALAAWFMREEEGGGTPWEPLRDLGTEDGPVFSQWIDDLRASRRLRNDDVTLVRVDVVG